MGKIEQYECLNCGNTVEINEGIGKLWHDFDKSMFYPPAKDGWSFNIYDELDKNMIDEIHSFIENSEGYLDINAYYQPYICSKCGKIESKLYFKITDYKSGKTYRPKYFCKCGNNYKRLTLKEKSHLYCNKCRTEMYLKEYMMWD